MYTKMYTIFRGKYGIMWHYKTSQQYIKSIFYGIVARIGIVLTHRLRFLSLRNKH